MAPKKREGIMLAYPLEEHRLITPKFGWEAPYIVQPKLDGERCRSLLVNDHSTILSSTEELVTGVPHIAEALEFVRSQVELPELDGELYCHGKSFEDIHSIVSRKYAHTLHPDFKTIKYHIFDVITNGLQIERTLALRDQINEVFSGCDFIEVVPSYIANNYEEVIKYYNEFIAAGYEGIIVREKTAPYIRRRSTFMLKFKEKRKDEYKVECFEEATTEDGERKGMVGAIWCIDEMGTKFKVGAGKLTHQERRRLWKGVWPDEGYVCKVGYQNLTAKAKVPRHGLCITLDIDKGNEDE